MIKTMTSMALWGLAAYIFGLWFSAASGWTVFSLGLAVMLLVRGVQLARIRAWSRDVDAPPPPSLGPWDDVLAPVYRKLRAYRQERARLRRDLDDLMLAGEALPDGVVLLSAEMAVILCKTAPGNGSRSQHFQYSAYPGVSALRRAETLGRTPDCALARCYPGKDPAPSTDRLWHGSAFAGDA